MMELDLPGDPNLWRWNMGIGIQFDRKPGHSFNKGFKNVHTTFFTYIGPHNQIMKI
jgi:hypothetical protein